MISRCLSKKSKEIGAMPAHKWAGEIAKLPEVCPYNDCNGNCRQIVSDYKRVQYRLQQKFGKPRR